MDTLGDSYILIPQDFGMIRQNDRYVIENHIQKKAIHHGQPIFIVNLKSNTMKNTVQIYELYVM